jgi:hypothetical protein
MRNLIGRVSLSRALLLTLTVFLSFGVAAAPAHAQDTMSAKEHYQKGTSYYDLGRYQDAIKEFEAAYQLKNDPALLFNLAQSHRLAGNASEALHFYRTYLRYVPKPPNRAEIDSRIAQLEATVAQKKDTTPPKDTTTPPPINNTNPPPPPVDTTPPKETPPPPLNTTPPINNNNNAPTPTYGAVTPVGAPPPSEPVASSGTGKKLRLAGLAGMGVGGLCIIIGAIEGGRAVGAANEINDTAKMGGVYDPAVEKRGKSAVALEKGFLITGFLVGAAGGVLYILGRQSTENVSVTPVASSDGVGAALRGAF